MKENLGKLIECYTLHCENQKCLSQHTIKAYRVDLNQFSDFVGSSEIYYSKQQIQTFIACLQAKYKIKSVKRKIATLKAFFAYLQFEELIENNPFQNIRIKLREPFLLPRTIPLVSIDSIFKCIYQQKNLYKEGSYKHGATIRDIAVLELLFATGIRVSELCSLRPSAVNLNNGTVKIYGKGAKERIVQIGSNAVLSAIATYYCVFSAQIAESGWFFVNRLGSQLSDQSVRCIIQKYTKLAGVDQHITPHMFRHSFATLLLEEDVDIRYIQRLLGHSSITTTQIYTHVSSKKQRDILTTKHPRNKISV